MAAVMEAVMVEVVTVAVETVVAMAVAMEAVEKAEAEMAVGTAAEEMAVAETAGETAVAETAEVAMVAAMVVAATVVVMVECQTPRQHSNAHQEAHMPRDTRISARYCPEQPRAVRQYDRARTPPTSKQAGHPDRTQCSSPPIARAGYKAEPRTAGIDQTPHAMMRYASSRPSIPQNGRKHHTQACTSTRAAYT